MGFLMRHETLQSIAVLIGALGPILLILGVVVAGIVVPLWRWRKHVAMREAFRIGKMGDWTDSEIDTAIRAAKEKQ